MVSSQFRKFILKFIRINNSEKMLKIFVFYALDKKNKFAVFDYFYSHIFN